MDNPTANHYAASLSYLFGDDSYSLEDTLIWLYHGSGIDEALEMVTGQENELAHKLGEVFEELKEIIEHEAAYHGVDLDVLRYSNGNLVAIPHHRHPITFVPQFEVEYKTYPHPSIDSNKREQA